MRGIVAVVLFLSCSAFVAESKSADPSTNVLLSDLTRCDRTFFETLKKERDAFATVLRFNNATTVAYFRVPDRADPQRSLLRFSAPIRIGTVEVVGYFDEVMGFGESGLALSWGFLVGAPIVEVVSSTESLIWEGKRLRKDNAVHVRSEVWDHSKASNGWMSAIAVADKAPAVGTVERVLLIESFDEDKSLTRFGCSLQGSVTPEMLRSERPDLGAN
jgi:hypothetical protein